MGKVLRVLLDFLADCSFSEYTLQCTGACNVQNIYDPNIDQIWSTREMNFKGYLYFNWIRIMFPVSAE